MTFPLLTKKENLREYKLQNRKQEFLSTAISTIAFNQAEQTILYEKVLAIFNV